MMEDDMPMPELYTALPYTAVAVIFFYLNVINPVGYVRLCYHIQPLYTNVTLSKISFLFTFFVP